MAGGWGSKKNGVKIGVFWDGIEYSGIQARITDPRVTIDRDVNISDSSNNLSVSGGAVTDNSWSNINVSGSGEARVKNCSGQWNNRNYGSSVTVNFSASFSGINYAGSTLTASKSVTFPALPYNLPNAPTLGAYGRVSAVAPDETLRVAWTNNPASPDKPYTAVVVERLVDDGTVWAQVSVDLASTATSWTDSSTTTGHRYKYRVRAKNSAGVGTPSAETAWIYTTPASPTSVSVAKAGPAPTDLTVNWVNAAVYYTGTEIIPFRGGVPDGSYTVGFGVATWADSDEDTGAIQQYSLRAYVSSVPLFAGGTVTVYSAASLSPAVQTAGPPNKPTVSVNHLVFDATLTALTLSWIHNPIDASAQTKYQIRYRYSTDGGTTWSGYTTGSEITSGASSVNYDPPSSFTNARLYEIQVKTWGSFATGSDWSDPLTFKTSTKPVVAIVSPPPPAPDPPVVTDASLELELTFTDTGGSPDPQTWRIRLYDDAMVQLWPEADDPPTLPGDTDVTPFTLPYPLEDEKSYTVRVEAQDADGLWSDPVDRAFDVEYSDPAPGAVTSSECDVENGQVNFDIVTLPPGEDEIEATSVTVQRQNGVDENGDPIWVDVCTPDGVSPDSDPLRINEARDPRATAWPANPTTGATATYPTSGGPQSISEPNAPERHARLLTTAAGTKRGWNLIGNPDDVLPAAPSSLIAATDATPLLSSLFARSSVETALECYVRPVRIRSGGRTNLAVNPSFESSPAGTTVWENLATNPSFEAAGSAAEVRRNLIQNPVGGNAQVGWTIREQWFGSGSTGTVTNVTEDITLPDGTVAPGYRRKTWTTVGAGAQDQIGWQLHYANTGRAPVTAGLIYTAQYGWRRSWSGTASQNRFRVAFYDAATGGSQVGSVIDGPTLAFPAPGTWQQDSITFTVPAGATHVEVSHWLYTNIGDIVVGSTLDATAAVAEISPVRLPPFWGSFSPDSDLTAAWLGTAHQSASTLSGVAPAALGFIDQASAIQSVQWASSGTKSLRTIPKTSSTASYVLVAGNAGSLSGSGVTFIPGQTYTALVTLRLSAPQTGSPSFAARRIRFVSNTTPGGPTAAVQESPQAPNVAGEHELRVTFTVPANADKGFLILYNGASAGNGDVWWDDFALVPGVYTGAYFSGAVSPDSDLSPTWTGTANASSSVLSAPALNAVTDGGGAGRKAIQSAQWARAGTKSLRLIFNTSIPDPNGAIVRTFSAPDVGKTFLVRATCRIAAPQTGTLHPTARRIHLAVPYVAGPQAPNVAGEHDLWWTFTVTNAAQTLRLGGGASAGNGDVWWDTLLVEDITGETAPTTDPGYFDGASSGGAWTGTANNSTSVLASGQMWWGAAQVLPTGELVGGFTNLATNPSSEAAAASVEVWRNLATNPSFETAGSAVEVRRNFATRPRGFSTGWNAVGGTPEWGVTIPPLSGVTTANRATATGSSDLLIACTGTGDNLVTAGDVVSLSIAARVSATRPVSLRYAFADAGGAVVGSVVITAPTTMAEGRVGVAGVTVPATAVRVSVGAIITLSGVVAGDVLTATAVLIEKSPVLGDYFDGAYSPDSDLTPNWNATPNASTSVLMGTLPVGVSGAPTTCKSFQSTQWVGNGTKSVRCVPKNTSNDTFVELGTEFRPALPASAGQTFTILGTLRMPAAQTGSLFVTARRYRAQVATPGGNVDIVFTYAAGTPANVAGVQDVRATFTIPADATGWNFLRAYNGASAGNGDVWWDNLVIVNGVYTGPYFDGSGPLEYRRNYALDPRATTNNTAGTNYVGWAARWYGSGGGAGTNTAVTGATDGPVLEDGVTKLSSYLRKTWSTSPDGNGDTGFEHTRGTSPANGVAGDGLIVSPGEVVTVSCYMRASAVRGGQFNITAYFKDASGVYISSAANVNVSPIAGQWQRLSGTFTVPAGAYRMCFLTDFDGSTPVWEAGDTLDGTGLLVERSGTLQPYFDGGFSPATDFASAWTGTANASPSALRDPDLTAAWVGSANASASTLSGVAVTTVQANGADSKYIQSVAWAKSGTKSVRSIAIAATNGTYTDIGYSLSYLIPGQTYTALATCRLAAPQTGTIHGDARKLSVRFYGSAAVEVHSNQAPNVAGEHECRVTFTIPLDTTGIAIRPRNGASAGNGDIWWDNFAVVQGTYTGPWFSGASPGASWTGSANASSSVILSEWQRVSTVPAVLPALTSYAAVSVKSAQALPSGAILDGSGALVEKATELLPYFDGDTPGDLMGYYYEWEGTANASRSIQYARLPLECVDMIPPLGGPVTYRVMTASEIPTYTFGEPFVVDCWIPPSECEYPDGMAIFLNAGPDWSVVAKIVGDPAVQEQVEQEKVLVTPVGRVFPIELRGRAVTEAYSLSGVVARDETIPSYLAKLRALREHWAAMALMPAPICYRDPFGKRIFGSLGQVQTDWGTTPVSSVSATLTRTGGGE